jgi:hypothetical protein
MVSPKRPVMMVPQISHTRHISKGEQSKRSHFNQIAVKGNYLFLILFLEIQEI